MVGMNTEKGVELAVTAIEFLRTRNVVVPRVEVVERLCAEALTLADRRVYAALSDPLTEAHRESLDGLFGLREGTKSTWLGWLREAPMKANSRSVLEPVDRLRKLQTATGY